MQNQTAIFKLENSSKLIFNASNMTILGRIFKFGLYLEIETPCNYFYVYIFLKKP